MSSAGIVVLTKWLREQPVRFDKPSKDFELDAAHKLLINMRLLIMELRRLKALEATK